MSASAPSAKAKPAMVRGDKALYLADGVSVLPGDIEAAFGWLERWEVAAPLRSYEQLAANFGDPEERAASEALVIDLRQPVYDPRVLFVLRSAQTERLQKAWRQEERECRCEGFCPLPFLRALWITKPLILALPAGWLKEG